jgi:N utilization substance protein B
MKRRLAREYAIQSLYHMEMNGVPAPQAVQAAIESGRDGDADDAPHPAELEPHHLDAVLRLVEGTFSRREEIDGLLSGYLKGWRLERLSRVDRQILRLAVYEMLYGEEAFGETIPPKVAVNEAIELAKYFGTEESGRFVNGVLGKMIQEEERIRSRMQV